MSLYDLQKRFSAAVKSDSSAAVADLIADLIAEKPPITVDQRMSIYQEGYVARRVESLVEDFPRIAKELGDAGLLSEVEKFVQTVPSRYTNMAEASQDFVEFLKGTSERLYFLAKMDWSEIKASVGADIPSARAVSVGEVQAGVHFNFRVAAAVHYFRCPIGAFVVYRKNGEVEACEVPAVHVQFLEVIASAATMAAFSRRLEAMNLKPEVIEECLSWFIAEQIVFCERI